MPILWKQNHSKRESYTNKDEGKIKMSEISKEQQEKINRLQLLEQSRQTINIQKQNFQIKLIEVESALKEIEKTEEAYKIVGAVMVKKDKTELKRELEEEKEKLNLRIKNIEKQEETIKNKMKSLQEEILKK